jgi:hypothetical protein
MEDDKAFFIIDSNHLDDVKDKLYGYAIYNKKLITHEDIDEDKINLTGDGLYINVSSTSDSIIIEQDFMGAWGLYVYGSGEYFAISNSFTKLVDYLKGKYELSLNKPFAESFLFSGVCSFSIDETLVNEIMFIPRYYRLVINKVDGKLIYEKIDYGENSVDIGSREGIELLDKWHHKWVSIVRFLRAKTNDLSFDLSGGFDSRMCASLWLSADINFDNINFNAIEKEVPVWVEDFEIASQIAEEYNFKLNGRSFEYSFFEDFLTPLINVFSLKLGARNNSVKQIFYKDAIYKFSGFCGETVQMHPNPSKYKYMRNVYKKIGNNDYSLVKSTESVVLSTLDKISEDFNVPHNYGDLMMMHYKETRNRFHFGKLAAELYLNNVVTLMPLMDVDLHKLKRTTENCGDNSLLTALILVRYHPKLLDFEFQGGREIDKRVMEFAREINEKYPFTPVENNMIEGPEFVPDKECKNDIEESESVDSEQIIDDRVLKLENFLGDVVSSDNFEDEFLKYFSSRSYYSIQRLKTENYVAYAQAVFAAVSCMRIIRDIEGNMEFGDDIEWLKSFLVDENEKSMNKDVKGLLTPFATAKIDMKNQGNEKNGVEIINMSDKYASVFADSFKNDKGSGAIIESYKGQMDFDIKCINSGKLKIWLRGKGIRNQNKNIFPTYVDFNSFKINDKDYITDSKVVSSEKPYSINWDVEDGEIVHVKTEWKPFNAKSIYENKLQEKLDIQEQKNVNINNELNKTKKELEETQKELNKLVDSNSSNLTKPLRKIIKNFKN